MVVPEALMSQVAAPMQKEPPGPSFLLNPLSPQQEDDSTQTAYCEWPLVFSHLEPYPGPGYTRAFTKITPGSRLQITGEAYVLLSLVILICECRCRWGSLGNAGVCNLGRFACWALYNLRKHSFFPLPHTLGWKKHGTVAE